MGFDREPVGVYRAFDFGTRIMGVWAPSMLRGDGEAKERKTMGHVFVVGVRSFGSYR